MKKLDMNVILTCPICGGSYEVVVNSEDYFDFTFGGKHAQDAFPYLNAHDREMFISGVCAKCWENIFPPEEEEEDA